MRAAVVLLALLASASAANDFYLCEVLVPSFCATPPSSSSTAKRDTCMSDPSLTLQGQSYAMTTGFNVISFGDFNAAADTEGRVLANGNAVLSTGYSIGEKVYTKGPGHTDQQYPYAALFGGNVQWPSGRLYPDGTDQYSASFSESMYIGGSFTGSADLAARKSSNTEAIATSMTNAQSFYGQVQTALDAVADNMVITSQYGTCTFTCSVPTASSYSVHASTATLGACTSYAFSGCASDVQMVINVNNDNTMVNFKYGAIATTDRSASKTVFNILGSGRTIKMTGVRFYGIILAPYNVYSVDTTAPGATDGIVIAQSVASAGQFNRVNCSVPTTPNVPSPCVSFESACAGTLFTAPGSSIQADTREYNAISFNNFVANTGDTEGRVMVRNSFTVGNGYSIGYVLQTSNNLVDRSQAYSLIAGGACTWGNGALYPDGTNIPYAGNAENIFCGSSFSGPSDLTARHTGQCAAAGCLNSIFDSVYTCYSGYSTTATGTSTNVNAVVKYSALQLTCSDATATQYVVNVDASLFNQFTYYTTSNCNFQAYWTINVVGTADVILSGDSFPAPRGAVVYNIAGSRTVYVYDTAVNGHILAVDATLNQTGGVILGKVVVGNVVSSLQINKEDVCDTLTYTNVPLVPVTPVTPNTPTLCPSPPTTSPVATFNAAVASSSYPSDTVLTGVDNNGCYQFNNGPITLIAANTKAGSIAIPSDAGGKVAPGSAKSSASTVVLSFAVLAAALLF